MLPEFKPFSKIARLSRNVVITEKLDGTNALVHVTEDGQVYAGSRNRWLTLDNDNYGFAGWVEKNKEDLLQLGPGSHYGEWWGSGIQRRYGLTGSDKRFSLFNVERWGEERPFCCDVVPVIYAGIFNHTSVEDSLEILRVRGSLAAPGFMDPEGIVIFHEASHQLFKKTLKNDEAPKSAA